MSSLETIKQQMEADLARLRRETEIHCPYCDAEYDSSDEPVAVSYWGAEDPVEIECEDCGKAFMVQEQVWRTYETSKKEGTDQ